MTYTSTWENKSKHVDSYIDYKNFANSARVVVYAASVDVSSKTGSTLTYNASEFVPIGVIQGFSHSEQRQIEQIFELGSDIPYIVPGRASGQLNLSRILISGLDLTNVLFHGADNSKNDGRLQLVKTLRDIHKPFDLLFAVFDNPDATTGQAKVKFSRLFRNCWIVARQESITANQTIIAENVSIVYQDMPSFSINGG